MTITTGQELRLNALVTGEGDDGAAPHEVLVEGEALIIAQLAWLSYDERVDVGGDQLVFDGEALYIKVYA